MKDAEALDAALGWMKGESFMWVGRGRGWGEWMGGRIRVLRLGMRVCNGSVTLGGWMGGFNCRSFHNAMIEGLEYDSNLRVLVCELERPTVFVMAF